MVAKWGELCARRVMRWRGGGRAWGAPGLGPVENFGLLKDIGIGLRLGSSSSALGNVVHIDVAFPLDGARSIDGVQFLVQTKRSF